MNQRYAGVVAMGAAVLMTTVGCSGGDSEPDSSGAADDGGGGGGPMAFVADAVNNAGSADSYRATMTMSGELEGVSVESSSDIEYVGDPEPTMRLTVAEAGAESSVLLRGSEILMSGAGFGGSEWVRMDAAELGADLATQDPASEVEKLLAANDVEEIGSEEIDGVATTGYAGSYSTEEALEHVDNAELAEAARQVYGDAGVDAVDFEVFIDDDGLPRRLVNTMGDATETVFEFRDFGEDLTIEYPTEDQIQDLGDLTDIPDVPDVPDVSDLPDAPDVEF
ncbi:hypothetical protein J4H86_04785 [Spiractinospora alimapuensis]|uniref:hypothetical protein n=1 Tax=Spiractinospora alimapuensis TaxID=2820884 RepID=UPI001F29FC06|nr:hypothetical protein [Spiractinospora alimapuensis]QVQ53113.1 hypothetical protein J4H86_04785 [Spiractinospora alimapuensis]